MTSRVFAVWIDGGDRTIVERLMESGRMPTLRGLCERGRYARLTSIDHSYTETTASMVSTGCLPERTGSWNMQAFCPDTYQLYGDASSDFEQFAPFYALGDAFRVTAFDIPFSAPHPGVNGLQVRAWGASSHDAPLGSDPPEVGEEILKQYGLHPARGGTAFAMLEDPNSLRDLFDRLMTGLQLREEVTLQLVRQREWDLFFTAFNETDHGGHYLWPHPDCRSVFAACEGEHFLERIYERIDAVLGRLVQEVADETRIVVFSAEGMRRNSDDLASMVFLPEFLLRYSFPGSKAMRFGDETLPPSPESAAGIKNWVMELWNYRCRTGKFGEMLRGKFSPESAVRIERLLGIAPTLFHPLTDNHFLNHQPLRWYQPYWRFMKAFALPTSSHGLIRLNVAGREKHGCVKASDYDRVWQELTERLGRLRDPGSGQSAVEDVFRIRQHPLEKSESKKQVADLVVQWHPDIGNCLQSSDFGQFGPVPYVRTGTHNRDGFLIAAGAGVGPGPPIDDGRPVDIAPTVLRLLGAPLPDHFDGRPLLSPTA